MNCKVVKIKYGKVLQANFYLEDKLVFTKHFEGRIYQPGVLISKIKRQLETGDIGYL